LNDRKSGFAPVGALGISGRATGRHWRTISDKPDQFFEVLDSSSEQKLVCGAGYPTQPQPPEAEMALETSGTV
jgi:hypothetical protein